MDVIVTRQLTKVYKTIKRNRPPSLDGLSLDIGAGEIFGFLGRNGAGKTTAIKILCGLIRPTAGDAFIQGNSIRSRLARRHLGYLPEQPYYYEYLTTRETLEFYGQLRGLSPAERARQWDRLSEHLDLRDIAGERIKAFSKGMRQRVGFAIALIGDPPVLILDEPMSGLDPLGRRMIRDLIVQQRERGKTVFFSSHVLGDVQQICDRVGLLVHGRLTRKGRLDELLGDHILRIEVVLRQVSNDTRDALRARAEEHRAVDTSDVFFFSEENRANDAVQFALANGAKLLEFTPVRETLEDYFMRVQQEDHVPLPSSSSAARYEE